MKKVIFALLISFFLIGCNSSPQLSFKGKTSHQEITVTTEKNGPDGTAIATYKYTGDSNLKNINNIKLSFDADGNKINQTINSKKGINKNDLKLRLTGSNLKLTKESKVIATIKWNGTTETTLLNANE